MTCEPCFTAFLDLTGLRTDLNNLLDVSIPNLPIDGLSAEYEAMGQFLNDIDDAATGFLSELNFFTGFTADIASSMLGLGINPGDCPQLDNLTSMIGSISTLTFESLLLPLNKMIGGLGDVSADLALDIGVINNLINNVNDMKC